MRQFAIIVAVTHKESASKNILQDVINELRATIDPKSYAEPELTSLVGMTWGPIPIHYDVDTYEHALSWAVLELNCAIEAHKKRGELDVACAAWHRLPSSLHSGMSARIWSKGRTGEAWGPQCVHGVLECYRESPSGWSIHNPNDVRFSAPITIDGSIVDIQNEDGSWSPLCG